MKTKFYTYFFRTLSFALLMVCAALSSVAQNATRSIELGIGRNCGAGTATTVISDSVKVFNFDDATNQLTGLYSCKPNLAAPSYSPYSGSLAFNPTDQNLYYIATTTGNNSYIWKWLPNTCPTGALAPAYTYTSRFIVGLDFDPRTGTGYQLEFNGSTAPYVISLRSVNFTTGISGPSDTLILPPGKNIYKQSGDVVFTPLGQLYFAFDNKLFLVDYSNYGPGVKLNTSFIDTLRLGNTLLGLSYAHGKFLASCQDNTNAVCSFNEIDISSGAAVISPITLPAGVTKFTGTDLASTITGIGVAKRVAGVTNTSATTYLVQYDIKVKNYGNTTLTNVQLTDSIQKVFGAAFVNASASWIGTPPSGLSLNGAYNGNTNCALLTGGATSKLAASPTDSAIIRVTVNLSNPNLTFTYNSTTFGSASSSFSTNVSDSSNQNNFLLPDPNFNSVPDEANEDIPTPLNFSVLATLPSNINNFSATPVGKKIILEGSVINNNGKVRVNLQRSWDNINFETIGTSESETTSQIKTYEWTDLEPSSSKPNYYRLKVVNADGTVLYSAVVRASIVQFKVEISAGPNPFVDYLNVDINSPSSDNISYTLLDLNGKISSAGKREGGPGKHLVYIGGLSSLKPGIYLLRIKIGDVVYDKKVIKSM